MKYDVPHALRRTRGVSSIDPCRNMAIAAIIEEILTEEPVSVYVQGQVSLESNEEKEENHE